MLDGARFEPSASRTVYDQCENILPLVYGVLVRPTIARIEQRIEE